ncbi:MAG: DUF362 domain-containing protein [Prevotella sp.]|nr:DUF362 domain-containing protein [Prevotella sp.]
MINFVDIETIYDSVEERNIDYLSHIYMDKNRMQAIIHRMITTYFELSDIAEKSVLLKPNWVRHELKDSDYLCLRTNDNLLLCILEEVLTMSPSKVLIADAPVQGCIWDKMITESFLKQVRELSDKYNVPIDIKDFRRTITDVASNKVSSDLHPMSDYLLFDLGSESRLEAITSSDNRFRVTSYDPDRMAEVHHKGMHKYCIAKDVFDYDVIITIPKLKTHRMAGMTNALKLLVGINGDKDYLPHHRIGSINEGGDNYKNKSLLRTLSNVLIDASNRRRGTSLGRILNIIGSKLWHHSHPDSATMLNAGWYGNDTIWRTVMDINQIALFGDRCGNIHQEQQRRLFIIMDGIIGGQGDGPLHPSPSALGVIACSDNPYMMDVVAGNLYHLNLDRIPLLREAMKNVEQIDEYSIIVNSEERKLDDVSNYGIDIEMSPGWRDYNK